MKEIAHIIPLGHEIDRAVVPFEKLKANRAYLLTTFENGKYSFDMIQKQRYYWETVCEKLEKKDITVVTVEVDIFNMLEVIKTVSGLVAKEKADGNTVKVNISAAGRLTSIGATLAAMANGAEAYYVKAKDYSENDKDKRIHGLSICLDPNQIEWLKPFGISLPQKAGLKVLAKLGQKPEEPAKINDLIEYLAKEGIEDYAEFLKINSRRFSRYDKQRASIKLNKGILMKLEEKGYISRERVGRENRVKITETGIFIAAISGMLKAKIPESGQTKIRGQNGLEKKTQI